MPFESIELSRLFRQSFGFRLPAALSKEFAQIATKKAEFLENELNLDSLKDLFCQEYILTSQPFELTAVNFEKEFANTDNERLHCLATIKKSTEIQQIAGFGNGALNALADAFKVNFKLELNIKDYRQHSITQGWHALAASYILLIGEQGSRWWGVGIDADYTLSAIRALLSAINRMQKFSFNYSYK